MNDNHPIGLSRRFSAWTIDNFFFLFISWFFTVGSGYEGVEYTGLTSLASLFAYLVYQLVCPRLFDSTLGSWVMGYRILSREGTRMRWWQAFVRFIGLFLVETILLAIPFIVCTLFRKDKATLYDMFSCTRVVYSENLSHHKQRSVGIAVVCMGFLSVIYFVHSSIYEVFVLPSLDGASEVDRMPYTYSEESLTENERSRYFSLANFSLLSDSDNYKDICVTSEELDQTHETGKIQYRGELIAYSFQKKPSSVFFFGADGMVDQTDLWSIIITALAKIPFTPSSQETASYAAVYDERDISLLQPIDSALYVTSSLFSVISLPDLSDHDLTEYHYIDGDTYFGINSLNVLNETASMKFSYTQNGVSYQLELQAHLSENIGILFETMMSDVRFFSSGDFKDVRFCQMRN